MNTFVIYHDNPEITEEDKLRISVCIPVPENTAVSGDVGKMKIQGGEYAMARFELGPEDFGRAWQWVFSSWLPESGYEPDDRTCFEMYHGDHHEHPEQKFILDICVPVKPVE